MGNDDFVRVPKEPTYAMTQAGEDLMAETAVRCLKGETEEMEADAADIYRAMIAAAPPSAPSGDNVSTPSRYDDDPYRAQCTDNGFLTPSELEGSSAAAAGKSREVDEDDLEPGELRPCPFCGGEAERIDFDAVDEEHENAGGSCIGCTNCGASSPVVFGYKETLYSSWNERSRLQPAAASEGASPEAVNQSRNEVIEMCATKLDREREYRMERASEIRIHDEDHANEFYAIAATVAKLAESIRSLKDHSNE